jgi:methionyl-tRNA synthetase
MQPWVTIKDENLQQQTHEVCTLGLNLFKVIMTYLQPIIPTIAEASETFLNYTFTWKNHSEFLMNHEINAFKPLLQRVEQQQLDDILIASQQDLQKNS